MSIASIVRGDALRVMEWANGGGTTREVAVWPPAAGLDDFDWRISLAEVSRDGDFSSFAGIDRILALIEGGAMDLTIDGVRHRLVPLQPVVFRGESSTSCTIGGGPTRDLNVMTRRGRATAWVELLASREVLNDSLGGSGVQCPAMPDETVWLMVLTGTWTCEPDPLVILGPGDFALIDSDVHLIGQGQVIRISVRPATSN
jgi:environmental stress-induced protein Ves